MNAYTTRAELALLASERISHPEHYADARRVHGGKQAGIFARIASYFERQRVLGELASLSDRELSDIGLHRSELATVFAPAGARRG